MECGEAGMNSVPDGVVTAHPVDAQQRPRRRRLRLRLPPLARLRPLPARALLPAERLRRGRRRQGRRGRRHRPDGCLRRAPQGARHLLPLLHGAPPGLARRADATLRVLELRMDAAAEKAAEGGQLDCIGLVPNLEELRLWGVSLTAAPAWGRMETLRVLEVVGAPLRDSAVRDAVAACPNLTDLSMLGCDCSGTVALDLHLLVRCRLDILGAGNCSLLITAPRLELLEVHGFTWITLRGHSLRRLSIAKGTGRVHKVDTGKLPDLEHLSLRGVQWNRAAVSSVLQCASEVKHLVMKIEFWGDLDALQPFPEVDLVDFFNSHPKLRKFEIHGAMSAGRRWRLDHPFDLCFRVGPRIGVEEREGEGFLVNRGMKRVTENLLEELF